ncbi:hypothetical protein [Litoreibacter janthinus]|uniref:Uncharacterized protein n=1 Tax=Litoreibacter janthinus TaxID=670154 RepID=A0A1I6IET9_9RHOB|nr:hypothetical protein [Litoreibacter janthinus]SFR65139.1 hypothetical protein SAMN04488002_3752 [Litoreibacter janthinus]
MKRLARILRIIPLAFFCAMFASAALRVQAERSEDAGKPSLPTRIGESRVEESFMQATFTEMGEMWMEVASLMLPGLAPADYSQKDYNSNSLDALKNRTRFRATDPTLSGRPALNF